LVVDGSAGDGEAINAADVESIGVFGEGISSLVVEGDIGNGESVRIANGPNLNRGVQDGDTGDLDWGD